MKTETRSVMFVVRGPLSLPDGRVLGPGIYPGSVENDFDDAGNQIGRRLSITLAAGRPDEEAVDITDVYNDRPQAHI